MAKLMDSLMGDYYIYIVDAICPIVIFKTTQEIVKLLLLISLNLCLASSCIGLEKSNVATDA